MQVYYINLAAETGRRAFMDRQLQALGLAATRLEAITPADLSAGDLEASCNPKRGNWLSPMELCCSLSHLLAMQALLSSGSEFALILEDDAVLSPRLPSFLARFEARSPELDLLRLETRHEHLRLLPDTIGEIDGIGLYRSYSWAAGAAGYIVSRRGAQKIIASPEVRLHAADRYLFNPYGVLPRQLVSRQINPALVIQADQLRTADAPHLPSGLVDRKTKRAAQAPYYWRRRPARIARAIQRDVVIAVQKAWHQYVRGAKKQPIPFLVD